MNARVVARDLMQTEVATLSVDDTIATALELFEDWGISGAPVVSNGRLVGMLTLADVGRPEHRHEGVIETETEFVLSEPVGDELTDELDPSEIFFRKEDYSPAVLGRELVGEWMARGVVSVAPTTPLQELCQKMVREHIHRVCVVDEDRLVGLVTTFDVVRHLAGAEPRRRAAKRPAAHRAASRHGTRHRP